jgi:hypothetical protein
VPRIFAILEALSEADTLAVVLAEVAGSRLVDTAGSSAGLSLVCSTATAVSSSAAAVLVPVAAAALVAVSALSPGWLMMALATS